MICLTGHCNREDEHIAEVRNIIQALHTKGLLGTDTCIKMITSQVSAPAVGQESRGEKKDGGAFGRGVDGHSDEKSSAGNHSRHLQHHISCLWHHSWSTCRRRGVGSREELCRCKSRTSSCLSQHLLLTSVGKQIC